MASLVASSFDYMATIVLRQIFKVDAVLSSITGTVIGGIVNFYVCRWWVFRSGQTPALFQGKRYLVIWFGNLLLNAGGVFMLVNFAGWNLYYAKVITSLTVAFGYNYPMQKYYVFRTDFAKVKKPVVRDRF